MQLQVMLQDSLKKLQDVTQVMATPLNMFKFKFKFKFNSTASKVLILQLTWLHPGFLLKNLFLVMTI